MVSTLGRLLVLLACLQTAPLQAERLSDSLSQQQQINIEFDWKYHNAGDELDAKEFNAVIAHARNVDTRLDTSDFVDTQARIFLELPVQVRGLNNPQRLSVSWTTNGLFQNGEVTPGNRRLIFEGKITQPVMRDIFNFTFEVDARFLTELLRLEPIYEIEIISP
ncbi:MAG: hypothetical protein DRQ45_06795 [Gammaproteobacteria bacterium]|nr:MAG: hypothetical protein DRQ45_06795 [Gammaproteobacteria bacterium]